MGKVNEIMLSKNAGHETIDSMKKCMHRKEC